MNTKQTVKRKENLERKRGESRNSKRASEYGKAGESKNWGNKDENRKKNYKDKGRNEHERKKSTIRSFKCSVSKKRT